MRYFILIQCSNFSFDRSLPSDIGDFTIKKYATTDELHADVGNHNFFVSFGGVNLLDVLNKPCFISTKDFDNENNAYLMTNALHSAVDRIFQFLWLIKDHSINTSQLFALSNEAAKISENHTSYTNASGKFEDTIISSHEFELAIGLYNSHVNIFSAIEPGNFTEFNPSGGRHLNIKTPQPYNKTSKLERALKFAQSARNTSLLPEKIAFYVMVIEALFGTSDTTTETMHKIKERVARYLGRNKAERMKYYKEVGLYYTVRSKFVHGQPLEKNKDDYELLRQQSVDADKLIRLILLEILTKSKDTFINKTDIELRDWFTELILN